MNTLLRRRTADWQTSVFRFEDKPPLLLPELRDASFGLPEILRPGLADAYDGREGRFNQQKGEWVFQRALAKKSGEELEMAALGLMVSSPIGETEASDWSRFKEWSARRSQPLSEKLIAAFARFYIARLNRMLKEARIHRPPPRVRIGKKPGVA